MAFVRTAADASSARVHQDKFLNKNRVYFGMMDVTQKVIADVWMTMMMIMLLTAFMRGMFPDEQLYKMYCYSQSKQCS